LGWDWVHLVLRPLFDLLYQPLITDDNECGAVGGMRIGWGNRSTRWQPVPVPLCPPQNPYGLTWGRTRAAVVGSRRQTAWAVARPTLSVAGLWQWQWQAHYIPLEGQGPPTSVTLIGWATPYELAGLYSVEFRDDRWMMRWKEFGRKWSWFYRGKDWGTPYNLMHDNRCPGWHSNWAFSHFVSLFFVYVSRVMIWGQLMQVYRIRRNRKFLYQLNRFIQPLEETLGKGFIIFLLILTLMKTSNKYISYKYYQPRGN
jgi:hypothetical protein